MLKSVSSRPSFARSFFIADLMLRANFLNSGVLVQADSNSTPQYLVYNFFILSPLSLIKRTWNKSKFKKIRSFILYINHVFIQIFIVLHSSTIFSYSKLSMYLVRKEYISFATSTLSSISCVSQGKFASTPI